MTKKSGETPQQPVSRTARRGGFALLLSFVAIAIVAAAFAQKKEGSVAREEEVVKKLEREWMQAYVNRDTAFLERHLADDYAGGYPDGAVLDKKSELASVKSGAVTLTEMKPLEMKVRLYGEVAVITGRSSIKAKVKGEDVSGEYRFTDVWVKRDDRWQAVASQVTRIAKP